MPRTRLPPTPLSSTDIVAKRKSFQEEMEGVFALPPAAVEIASTRSNNVQQITPKGQASPSVPSEDSRLGLSSQRKRTLSGTSKSRPRPLSPPPDNDDLPPPPSRARKIIEMKPKRSSSKLRGKVAGADFLSSSSTHHEPAPKAAGSTKQKASHAPATSAAGRKIARKTAHSIIERRRRSKMNEEFGVLKDMIPACNGVEMHKLAILQAGIEYVRYLEDCVEQLKAQRDDESVDAPIPYHNRSLEDQGDDYNAGNEMDTNLESCQQTMEQCDESISAAGSDPETSPTGRIVQAQTLQSQRSLPPLRASSVLTNSTNSTYVSPALAPVHSSSSTSISTSYQSLPPQNRPSTSDVQQRAMHSTSPPPLTLCTPLQSGISPAFNALQFSPDFLRTPTWTSMKGSAADSRYSLNLLPLPQAAMPLPRTQPGIKSNNNTIQHNQHSIEDMDEHAEATATAALLMMTTDRRGSVVTHGVRSSKGMSVRDLLIS